MPSRPKVTATRRRSHTEATRSKAVIQREVVPGSGENDGIAHEDDPAPRRQSHEGRGSIPRL